MSKVSEQPQGAILSRPESPDEGIDFSDIPATVEADWSSAIRGRFSQSNHTRLSIDLDADVSEWLTRQGGDYRERVNGVLRKAMNEEFHSSRAGSA